MLSAVHGDLGKEVSSSALSVLINPEDPHTVQLGQLGDEYSEQGNGVDHKMGPIVFGVEAGEYIPESEINNRRISNDYRVETRSKLTPDNLDSCLHFSEVLSTCLTNTRSLVKKYFIQTAKTSP